MKRLLLTACFVLALCVGAHAQTKISALPSGTPVQTDIVPYVADPGGTPTTKKTTVADLFSALTPSAVSAGSKNGNGAKFQLFTGAFSLNECSKFDASGNLVTAGAPCGTVTSVGLSMPAEFSVSGSPVTGSGTLTVTRTTQAANSVLAGPTTGSAAVPTFRALVAADIPTHTSSKISDFNTAAAAAAPVQSVNGLTGAVSLTLPANTTATASQFFTAYNSSTGAFTKAQPSFSDLSGTATAGQIPSTLNATTAPSFTLSGTAGAGFVSFPAQSSNPSAPASGFNLFACTDGKFCYRRSDGYVRKFDGGSVSGDITWTMPNTTATIARTDAGQDFTGQQRVQAGASTSYIPVGGTLCVSYTAASTTGTVDQSLFTCTLPANALSADGKAIRIRAWGTLAANANNKMVTLKFGATTLATRTSSGSGLPWVVEATVVRTGASAQTAYAEIHFGTTTLTYSGNVASPAETLSGAVTIDLRAITATAAGDLTALAMIVEVLN